MKNENQFPRWLGTPRRHTSTTKECDIIITQWRGDVRRVISSEQFSTTRCPHILHISLSRFHRDKGEHVTTRKRFTVTAALLLEHKKYS